MITSGLPPLVQMLWQHGFEPRLGEGDLRAVGAGARAVGRRRVRSASSRALRRVRLDPREHGSGLARSGVVAGRLGLVGAGKNGFHVALELEALEHLLVGELVVAAGMIDRALSAGDAGNLGGDLVDVAKAHRRRGGVGVRVVAFELRVGVVGGREGLGLPFVIHGGRLLTLDARHERRIGRVDTIDHIGEVFAVADRLVGGEGIGRESHGLGFLFSGPLPGVRPPAAPQCAWRSCRSRFGVAFGGSGFRPRARRSCLA